MMFDYPVTVTPDGDAWLVTFVDVPEAITFGSCPEEALLNAVDALEPACLSMSTLASRCLRPVHRQQVKQQCVQQHWNVPSWACTKP
jgi:hypothetical protein